jgi:hypothetical protein
VTCSARDVLELEGGKQCTHVPPLEQLLCPFSPSYLRPSVELGIYIIKRSTVVDRYIPVENRTVADGRIGVGVAVRFLVEHENSINGPVHIPGPAEGVQGFLDRPEPCGTASNNAVGQEVIGVDVDDLKGWVRVVISGELASLSTLKWVRNAIQGHGPGGVLGESTYSPPRAPTTRGCISCVRRPTPAKCTSTSHKSPVRPS